MRKIEILKYITSRINGLRGIIAACCEGRRNGRKMVYKKYALSELVSKLIINRNITSDEMIRSYINPDFDKFHKAREMKDLEKSVDILRDKIESQKKIRIVGDCDV